MKNTGVAPPPVSRIRQEKTYSYFIILPDDKFKGMWDIVNMILILFVCVTAPARIAFTEEDNLAWMAIGLAIDSFFLIDLVLNFFTAYHDEEYNLVDSRRVSPPASSRSKSPNDTCRLGSRSISYRSYRSASSSTRAATTRSPALRAFRSSTASSRSHGKHSGETQK